MSESKTQKNSIVIKEGYVIGFFKEDKTIAFYNKNGGYLYYPARGDNKAYCWAVNDEKSFEHLADFLAEMSGFRTQLQTNTESYISYRFL